MMVSFIEAPAPVRVRQERPPVPEPRVATARPKAKLIRVEKPPVLESTSSSEPALASSPVSVPMESQPHVSAESAAVVKAARFDASYLRNSAPPYPPQSRRLGEEGKVVLRVIVTVEGGVDSVEVKSTSGSYRLDEAALRTVRYWRFVPASRDGIAIQSAVLVPIYFKLEF